MLDAILRYNICIFSYVSTIYMKGKERRCCIGIRRNTFNIITKIVDYVGQKTMSICTYWIEEFFMKKR